MASRTYDVKLTVEDSDNAYLDNFFGTIDLGGSMASISGSTYGNIGIITAKDRANKYIYLKLSNSSADLIEAGDDLYIGNTKLSSSGSNTPHTSEPFYPKRSLHSHSQLDRGIRVSKVEYNRLFKEKNIFEQTPIVRLYSVYYPGEWYKTGSVNPDNDGKGRAWPHPFPLYFCETIGEKPLDENYTVLHDGIEYTPVPVDPGNITEASDGKITDVSISLFNEDNFISNLIDDPYLGGYDSSNYTRRALVNNELVSGIDKRTVSGESTYDSSIVDKYGANATMTKDESDSLGGTWNEVKEDSRDLLGGIVTIKSTFAKFLDYWPEYSIIDYVNDNNISVKNSYVYRVGDNVVSNSSTDEGTIMSITGNIINTAPALSVTTNHKLYIVNPQADSESYVEEVFKINQLESLNEHVATFNLTSWLQYFKHVLPKRKYYTNTCGFKYKDDRCGYPGPRGSSTSDDYKIKGTTNLYSNTHPITITNDQGSTNSDDVCNKTLEACRLRNNSHRFGGFISVRR